MFLPLHENLQFSASKGKQRTPMFLYICNLRYIGKRGEGTTANEAVSEQSLIVYPNPTNGIVTIHKKSQKK